jgi:hypothetical protein
MVAETRAGVTVGWRLSAILGVVSGVTAVLCAGIGYLLDINTPGDFANPFVLLAYLAAAGMTCLTALSAGVYAVGSLVRS